MADISLLGGRRGEKQQIAEAGSLGVQSRAIHIKNLFMYLYGRWQSKVLHACNVCVTALLVQ